MKQAPHLVLLAVLSGLLAGCGFALRDAGSLPPAMARVNLVLVESDRPLENALTARLVSLGATLEYQAAAGVTQMRVADAESGQRVLSVSTTGGPEEYEVYYRARLELLRDGKRTFGPQAFTLTRDYTFDKRDVLGKQREFEQLRSALAEELATLLVRRAVLASRGSADAGT